MKLFVTRQSGIKCGTATPFLGHLNSMAFAAEAYRAVDPKILDLMKQSTGEYFLFPGYGAPVLRGLPKLLDLPQEVAG